MAFEKDTRDSKSWAKAGELAVKLEDFKGAIRAYQEAIRLDPRSAPAYLSRGVGNYYLPKSFGGGLELALRDIDKAIELNPSFAEAHLWRGIVLRKAGRAAEARKAIEKCLQLNPNRVWARLQLEKTPAQ